ncbi:Hypothetical predicted protein, partial [Pelobates cultripes]
MAVLTEHLLSHWEAKFHAAFDALCEAFLSRIESCQKKLPITSTAKVEVFSGNPVLCSSSRPRANMGECPSSVHNPVRMLAEQKCCRTAALPIELEGFRPYRHQLIHRPVL